MTILDSLDLLRGIVRPFGFGVEFRAANDVPGIISRMVASGQCYYVFTSERSGNLLPTDNFEQAFTLAKGIEWGISNQGPRGNESV